MPFHSHRPQRVPDRHFNRPQGPVQMPPKQPRPQPGRVFSYDAASSGMTYKPVYHPPHPSMATPVENVYATPPLTTICTPDSFSMGSTYLPSSLSPETADPSDMWGPSFDFGNLNEQHLTHQDFGLGLGALGSDIGSKTFNKMVEMNRFPYPSLVNEVETLAFDPGSPDGQSWSSLSEASAGLSSDMADCSPSTHRPTIEPEFPADLDAFLRSANTTPSVPQYSFAQPPSHCRAESAPRHSFRTSPYPTNFGRGRSFSTGSAALSRTQRASNYIQTVQQASEHASHHSSPLTATNNMDSFTDNEFEMYCQSNQSFTAETNIGPAPAELASFGVVMFGETAQTSSELVNVLQSNGSEKHLCEHHFAGATSPPDLFGPLSEEPSSPPPEDFDCDESQMPRAQDLRFEGDMYTPRYVRGHGNKREGWCGTCKPGRWLVLKNSAFWYDKSFSHGISAATGSPFEGPRETRRMKGNPDVWEGLCGSCNDWIALISSKKKGTTWFRHAYKCHTHQKVKDTTKRRREVTQGRTAKAAKASSLKNESREQSPFSMAPLDEADETDIHGGGEAVSYFANTI
ncbi:MAG: hypothetical protein L6R38_005724 [Xanthoria sp. 2 TBL-2021]|nr:MAG: hypothetical protein L6R38_005724 [Xanthoria sp. 2 TBL-2021]